MLTFVKHNIKKSNTLIFRGYNYNAPMAIILMMFKITMAWVSQFIQSVLVEKNYSKRWTKTGSCPWRMHGAKSRPGAYTITRDVPILRWAGWRHLNLLKSLPVAWICSQHEAGYSWLWLEHIRGLGQPFFPNCLAKIMIATVSSTDTPAPIFNVLFVILNRH